MDWVCGQLYTAVKIKLERGYPSLGPHSVAGNSTSLKYNCIMLSTPNSPHRGWRLDNEEYVVIWNHLSVSLFKISVHPKHYFYALPVVLTIPSLIYWPQEDSNSHNVSSHLLSWIEMLSIDHYFWGDLESQKQVSCRGWEWRVDLESQLSVSLASCLHYLILQYSVGQTSMHISITGNLVKMKIQIQ